MRWHCREINYDGTFDRHVGAQASPAESNKKKALTKGLLNRC